MSIDGASNTKPAIDVERLTQSSVLRRQTPVEKVNADKEIPQELRPGRTVPVRKFQGIFGLGLFQASAAKTSYHALLLPDQRKREGTIHCCQTAGRPESRLIWRKIPGSGEMRGSGLHSDANSLSENRVSCCNWEGEVGAEPRERLNFAPPAARLEPRPPDLTDKLRDASFFTDFPT